MKFTYTGKALETKLMIEEGRKVYTINKLYKHSRGFYWKVNRMGYIQHHYAGQNVFKRRNQSL